MAEIILKNLQTAFLYRVNLVGLSINASVKVQKVTTPDTLTTSERTHFERGHKIRLAGTTANDDTLTLEMVVPNSVADRDAINFVRQMRDPITGIRTLPQNHMITVRIQELNEVGATVRLQIYENCVLNKVEAPDFDASSSENAIEKITFFVNGANMV